MAEYYTPSGRFSLAALPLLAVGVPLAAVLTGTVYAALAFYNPFIYVTALATAAYGFAVGFAVSWVAKRTRVRAPWLVWAAGLLGGLFAAWWQWIATIGLAAGDPVVALVAVFPPVFVEIVQNIAAEGMWNIKGHTPTGWELYLVWSIEALIIVGVAFMTAMDSASAPFCERSERWFTEAFALPVAVRSPNQRHLEAGDLAAFELALPDSSDHFHLLRVMVGEGPPRTGAVSLEEVVATTNAKGKREEKRTHLVRHRLFRGEALERIMGLPDALRAQLAQARAAAVRVDGGEVDGVEPG